ncbi:hypothetical protein [Ketogulonicigenium robustum]|uniref:hypothetical protein n=1 Tax=Ketogulonicigenium robustum TaxID=92947 RepID=UPI0012F4A471|nr:hypothetical protein [Ketogulonicigenium robustum]
MARVWGLCHGAVLLGLAIVVGLGLLVLGYAIDRDIAAPRWLRDEVAAAASEALGEGRITFGALTVRLQPDLHPIVTIRNAALYDGDDREIAVLPAVSLHLSPRGLLLRRDLLVQRITSAAAEVELTRDANGVMALRFGAGTAAPAADFSTVFQQFDEIFESPVFEALRSVEIDGLVVRYTDLRSARSMTLDGGSLRMALDAQRTVLSAQASVLSGRDYATQISLAYQSPRHSPAASAVLRVDNVAAADIGYEIPGLGALTLLDARISGDLQMQIDGQGALQSMSAQLDVPGGGLLPGVAPSSLDPPAATFDNLSLSLAYDPASQRVDLQRMAVASRWASFTASGAAYLQDFHAGLPAQISAQLAMEDIAVAPPGFYSAPAHLSGASADFRVTLQPLRIDVAGLTLQDASGGVLQADGQIAATPEGWSVRADAGMDRLPTARLIALWPQSMRAAPHHWMASSLSGGEAINPHLSLRKSPTGPLDWALSTGFQGVMIDGYGQLPVIADSAGFVEITAGRLGVGLTAGHADPPEGGRLDMGGSAFTIAHMGASPVQARLDLQASGPVAGMLSVLDQPPFGFMTKANVPVDLTAGQADMKGWVTFPLHGGPVPASSIGFGFDADVRDVYSTKMVPGKVIEADHLQVSVTPETVAVTGPAFFQGAAAEVRWWHDFGAVGSHVAAAVPVDSDLFAALDIDLPLTLRGQAQGELTVDLATPAPPRFRFESDLVGLGVSVPVIGWAKGASQSAPLVVEGVLGTPAEVTALTLDAPGLAGRGRISLSPDGGLARADFDRLHLNGWLDAPLTLIGRGTGQPMEVNVGRGVMNLSGLGSLGQGGGGGASGPLSLALARFHVFPGLDLNDVDGQFDGSGGLTGRFTARVNGVLPVAGRVFTQDGRQGVQITGADAGLLVQALGVAVAARGGDFTLTIVPDGAASYLGQFVTGPIQIHDAPVLAQILDAASVVGLIQQMVGMGIAFDSVDATFRIDPGQVTLLSSSAMGAGLGISLDGAYRTDAAEMRFQGVVSPVYFLNGIGQAITRRGEGVFGMTFTLDGPPGQVRVGVNPLSLLAPGFLREAFRRPVPPMPEDGG